MVEDGRDLAKLCPILDQISSKLRRYQPRLRRSGHALKQGAPGDFAHVTWKIRWYWFFCPPIPEFFQSIAACHAKKNTQKARNALSHVVLPPRKNGPDKLTSGERRATENGGCTSSPYPKHLLRHKTENKPCKASFYVKNNYNLANFFSEALLWGYFRQRKAYFGGSLGLLVKSSRRAWNIETKHLRMFSLSPVPASARTATAMGACLEYSTKAGVFTSASCTARAPIWWLWGPPWRAGNTAMSIRSFVDCLPLTPACTSLIEFQVTTVHLCPSKLGLVGFLWHGGLSSLSKWFMWQPNSASAKDICSNSRENLYL